MASFLFFDSVCLAGVVIVLVKSFAGKGIQTKPDVEATSCRELVRQLKDTAPGTAFGLA